MLFNEDWSEPLLPVLRLAVSVSTISVELYYLKRCSRLTQTVHTGYKLVGLKMVWPTKEMAATHYQDLSKKPFFGGLVEFFSSGPIVCMCWEGKDVIRQGRQMLGETQPLASKPGSIRGDYSIDLGRNICHGSDSPEGAEHELKMWFPEGVNDWAKNTDAWIYE